MSTASVRAMLAFVIMSAVVLLNVSVTLGNNNQQQSEPVVHASAGSRRSTPCSRRDRRW